MASLIELDSTQSPLLRLPGELRNKIWRYATRGYLIELLYRDGPKVRLVHEPIKDGENTRARTTSVSRLLALRKVCRQICAEIPPRLAGEGNTFYLEECLFASNRLLSKLCPQHLASIRTLAVIAEFVCDLEIQYYERSASQLRASIPNLQRLLVLVPKRNTPNEPLPEVPGSMVFKRRRVGAALPWLAKDKDLEIICINRIETDGTFSVDETFMARINDLKCRGEIGPK